MQNALLEKIQAFTNADYTYLDDIFAHYSQHPEPSLQEFKTAQKQLTLYREAGCDRVEFCAGTGVVAVIQNGAGKTVLCRNDHDALLMQDQIEGRYRSLVPGVAHKCGHSMVPAISVGVARNLVRLKEYWEGTVVLVSQLGEEGADGAGKMLRDGLYERFPKPDMALAYHCSPTLPVGQLGFRKGFAFATTSMGSILVKGQGGHGGAPDTAIDPIVLASSIVMRLQTIVSREMSPFEPAVVSVCSFVSSSQYPSVIPDSVAMKFTVRCMGDAAYNKITAAMERICNAEAAASNLPPEKYPVINHREYITDAVYNDPHFTTRLEGIFGEIFGQEAIKEEPCYAFGEDFGHYALKGEIPISLIWLGSVSPDKFDNNGKPVVFLEPLHSPKFMPEPETLVPGVVGMTGAVIALLELSPVGVG